MCGYVSITVLHFNIILPFAPTLPLGLFPWVPRIKMFVWIPHSLYILQLLQIWFFNVFWQNLLHAYCKFYRSGEHGNGSPVTYTARNFFICGANISSPDRILLDGLTYLFYWLAQFFCVNARMLLYCHIASHDLFIICIIFIIIVILPLSTFERA